MSIKVMDLVFDAQMSDLPYLKDGEQRMAKASTAKLVLLAYADHANEEGETAYPGYDRLEVKTALSRQGISDTLEALRQNGFIEKEGVSKLGTNSYRIDKKKLESLRVKPLDSAESSHLTPVSQATGLEPSSTSGTSSGSKLPNIPLSIENKIALGLPIEEGDLDAGKLKHDQMVSAANLVATGTGTSAIAIYGLVLAFEEARDLVVTDIKGTRRAARDMLKNHVAAEHVRLAVVKLIGINYTVTDLWSIYKTAVDLANPKPEAAPAVLGAPKAHLVA